MEKASMWAWLKTVTIETMITTLWSVPLLICLSIALAKALSFFKPELNNLFNHQMNWPITLAYGGMLVIPIIAATIKRRGRLALSLLVCLGAWTYSAAISIDNPYYWGHVPKAYLIVWAICLALSQFPVMAINFLIAAVAYVMVERYGARIGPGIATDWKLAHNALYVISACIGMVAAVLPTIKPPYDAQEDQQKTREHLHFPKPKTEEKKAA